MAGEMQGGEGPWRWTPPLHCSLYFALMVTAKAMMDVLPQALENILARKAAELAGRMTLEDYVAGAMIEDTQGEGALMPFEPWDHLMESLRDWETGENDIVLKARQLGFSQAVALYAGRVARKPGNVVLLLSQGQDEAYELLRKVRTSLVEHKTHPAMLTRDGSGVIEIAGGGRIIALPSTSKAGRGYTARLVITDEAAFHPFARANYAGYKNTIADGGQHIIVSTANGTTGWYAEMWQQAISGDSNYNARFYPWSVRPGRTEEWYEKERRDFVGMQEIFRQENPATPEEAFVGLEGLVYPQFSAARHVLMPKLSWDSYKWRVAGVDFGGGDPTAVIPLGVRKDGFVEQYGEMYKRGPTTTEDIIGYLWKLHEIAPFDAILCDKSEPVAIATMKAAGLPAYAADKDRSQGLQWVSFLLDNNRLSISPHCKNSIHEFSNYRWRESTDPNSKDRFATSTPVDHHADAMDARRYAIMHIMRSAMRDTDQRIWSVSVA